MHRRRRRCLDRDEGGLKCQVFLRMHAYPFMDEVGVEIVGQRDIGDRGVRLSAFGDDLGLEGLGIGTAFLWHRRPLKKAKNGVHLNLGGHHRLKRRCQEGVLPGRLLSVSSASNCGTQKSRLMAASLCGRLSSYSNAWHSILESHQPKFCGHEQTALC